MNSSRLMSKPTQIGGEIIGIVLPTNTATIKITIPTPIFDGYFFILCVLLVLRNDANRENRSIPLKYEFCFSNAVKVDTSTIGRL